MKKKKHGSRMSRKTGMIFGLAAILIALGTAGSSRAALTYFSENYQAEVEMDHIGVTLVENDTDVSHRNFISRQGEFEPDKVGSLLSGLQEETIQPTKKYKEELKVRNTGEIDQYVRVSVSRYWTDENGTKKTDMDPELIDLHFLTGDGWVIDESASTPEKTVLYYKYPLDPEKNPTTKPFADTISIDGSVELKVEEESKEESTDGYTTTVTTTYRYDKANFALEADVDAVQTHNAEDAIKSAWGVDVEDVAANGTLTYEFE